MIATADNFRKPSISATSPRSTRASVLLGQLAALVLARLAHGRSLAALDFELLSGEWRDPLGANA